MCFFMSLCQNVLIFSAGNWDWHEKNLMQKENTETSWLFSWQQRFMKRHAIYYWQFCFWCVFFKLVFLCTFRNSKFNVCVTVFCWCVTVCLVALVSGQSLLLPAHLSGKHFITALVETRSWLVFETSRRSRRALISPIFEFWSLAVTGLVKNRLGTEPKVHWWMEGAGGGGTVAVLHCLSYIRGGKKRKSPSPTILSAPALSLREITRDKNNSTLYAMFCPESVPPNVQSVMFITAAYEGTAQLCVMVWGEN